MSANLGIDGARASPDAHVPWREASPKVAMPQHAVPQPATTKAQAAEAPHPKISRDEREKNIQEAVAHLNEQLRKNDRSLQFSLDKEAHRTVIKVTNPHTGEVVRQIPDEAVLRVAHNIEAIKGLLFNELT